jgi:hypothetical protein
MAHPPRRSSWTAWVLTLLIPLLALGCKKMDSGAMSPGYGSGGYDEDYGGEADYEYRADYGPSTGAMASSRFSAPRREFAADKQAEAPPAPPMEPSPEPMTIEHVEQSKPEPKPEPVQQAATKRQIIYTATMQVSVYDVAHAVAIAEALPEQLGGWLHQRSDNQLTLRIPAEKLQQAMDTIAELGVVDYRLLEALDVTAQYTDLEARLRVLEEMQTQLQALLAKATTVEQALEIRRALDSITLELELARGQMRELAKSIAFSTLILRFVQRGPAVSLPSSNDPFSWVDGLGVEITEYR